MTPTDDSRTRLIEDFRRERRELVFTATVGAAAAIITALLSATGLMRSPLAMTAAVLITMAAICAWICADICGKALSALTSDDTDTV